MSADDREFELGGPFAVFYAAERQRAVGLAWLLTRDASAAEDVAHDAFASVFHRFVHLDDPAAYLRRSIVNSVYQRHRGAGREARRLTLIAAALPTTIELATDDSNRVLVDAIAALPLDQRTVVVLRYWSDLDHNSIADVMGVRPGTVRSLLSRATSRLRKDLDA